MATEDDALRTLQNIEKLLKSATALSANKSNFSGRTQQSQKERADREMRKTFKAVASSAKNLNDSFLGLNKSIIGLNDEVGSTTKSFGALNSQMVKFMTSLQPIQVPETEERGFVDNAAIIKAIGVWGNSTVKAIENLGKVLQSQPSQTESKSFFARVFGKPAETQKEQKKRATPVPKSFEESDAPIRSFVGRLVQNFGKAAATAGGLSYALEKLVDVAGKVAADYFELARVGMGTTQNLKDLYIHAAQAGMSFEEYNAMLKTSMTVAGKAGTLDNFNKIISAQDNVLASMGIFGKEARQFQASIAQSTAVMGINVDDLTKATAAQVKTFDRLRKITGMTAEEFAGMVSSLSKNADVQRELVGLDPKQRGARLQELLHLQTIGLQMGMTADASKQLGDALIKQRQSTVKERIEQGSALMQLAAFTGNGALGQRAYELNMKGRRRSKAEDEELLMIVRQLDSQAQGLYENGSLGMQNALDHFDEALNKGSLGDLVKQGRGATLAKDAGQQNQEAFGHHVSDFGKFVGDLTTWARGIKQSIAAPIIAAVGAGLLGVFRGPILSMLGKAVGSTASPTAAAETGSILSKLAESLNTAKNAGSSFVKSIGKIPESIKTTTEFISKFAKGTPAFFRNAFNAVVLSDGISGALNTIKFTFQEFGSTLLNGSRGILVGSRGLLAGISNTLGRFPIIAGLLNSAVELFTGKISDALNPNGGMFDRIGGVITAFFSALPQMMIDTIAYIFGGDEMKKRMQNGFDTFVAAVNAGFRYFFANVIQGWTNILSWLLPDDSKLVKDMQGWADGLSSSAQENWKVAGELLNDQNKTLASVSEENKKRAEVSAKTTDQAAQKVNEADKKFNNVIDASQVSAAQAVSDAKVLTAQPEIQVQKPIQPAPVNTNTAAEVQPQPSSEVKPEATNNSVDILKALQDIAQVLRESLMAEQRQADNTGELLVRLARNPVSFQSPEEVQKRLLKRG